MLACPSVSLWLHWKKALPVCGGRSGGNGSRPEGRPIHLEGLLVQKEGFGIFFGDYEEFECRLLGAAKALLPAADGVGADVEIGGEEGLAGVEIAADLPDFAGGDGARAGGNAGDAEIHGFAAFVGGGIAEGFAQVLEDVYFDFLGHVGFR